LSSFDVEVEGASLAAKIQVVFPFEDDDVDVVGTMCEQTRQHTPRWSSSNDGDLETHASD
jgi:hypothetical protein